MALISWGAQFYIFDVRNGLSVFVLAELQKGLGKLGVTVSKPVLAIIALLFGMLVILMPDLLEWIVGLYFIIQGILLLSDYMELRRK